MVRDWETGHSPLPGYKYLSPPTRKSPSDDEVDFAPNEEVDFTQNGMFSLQSIFFGYRDRLAKVPAPALGSTAVTYPVEGRSLTRTQPRTSELTNRAKGGALLNNRISHEGDIKMVDVDMADHGDYLEEGVLADPPNEDPNSADKSKNTKKASTPKKAPSAKKSRILEPLSDQDAQISIPKLNSKKA